MNEPPLPLSHFKRHLKTLRTDFPNYIMNIVQNEVLGSILDDLGGLRVSFCAKGGDFGGLWP